MFVRYGGEPQEDSAMLLTLAIIILILWALGFLAFHIASPLIHLLLVIGIIVLIVNFVRGRPTV
jgi:membrane-bound ClpP family serine protease